MSHTNNIKMSKLSIINCGRAYHIPGGRPPGSLETRPHCSLGLITSPLLYNIVADGAAPVFRRQTAERAAPAEPIIAEKASEIRTNTHRNRIDIQLKVVAARG
jgi:hypothetical protein